MVRGLVWLLMLLACGAAATAAEPIAAPRPDSQPAPDFLRDVAPLFAKRCVECHGPEAQESGLRLDRASDAFKGGYSGAVIIPGKSSESRLLTLIRGQDADGVVMPPEGDRLSEAEIAAIAAWIDAGANWPEKFEIQSGERSTPSNKKSEHWSFQPIAQPAIPEVQDKEWLRTAIDGFVLSRLEDEQISPAPEADRRTLIRRVTLDLIGLLPTPDEVAEFVSDSSPDAYERLVDRLLASPRYGERWARPWLDLCHFGESDGYLTDQLRPVAWRYRQWLVDALNANIPFDQFTVEQLAGDLLPEATVDQRIATGFLRNTLSNREGGADLEEFRVLQIVDRAELVGTTWLGLTFGCARCHDHKFDPITQREFYELYAVFDAADEVNIDAPLSGELETVAARKPEYDRRRAELIAPVRDELNALVALWEDKLRYAAAHPGEDHRWDRAWEVLGLVWGGNLGEGQLEGCQIVLTNPAQRTQDEQDRLLDYFLARGGDSIDGQKFNGLNLNDLAASLEKLKAEYPHVTRAPAMREMRVPRRAYLHVRGDFRTPGIDVEPHVPNWLGVSRTDQVDRRVLAEWLVSRENPLTARVVVNRLWQELFGAGLVETPADFGTRGALPSHPELLDWLASEFREELQWDVKALHRLIVTSAVYRQSSHARPELKTRDPNNRRLARQSGMRLSAEAVRDVVLQAAGLLDGRIGGPSVFPPQPESVAMEGFSNKWPTSSGADRYRRGLYTFTQRMSHYAQSVTFDGPDPSRSCTRRERSNTPLQALTLLNDPVFFEAARHLAARVTADQSDADRRIDRLFQVCLGREPSEAERTRLLRLADEMRTMLQSEPASVAAIVGCDASAVDENAVDAAMWTNVSSTLLNLHEFITRE